jgi:hypothetical protein
MQDSLGDLHADYYVFGMRTGGIADMALEKEMETFTKRLPELKQHEGKFVLIQGENVVDFFSSYDDAIKAGYQKFGLDPFLVKQIQATAQVQFISRWFDPMLSAAKA